MSSRCCSYTIEREGQANVLVVAQPSVATSLISVSMPSEVKTTVADLISDTSVRGGAVNWEVGAHQARQRTNGSLLSAGIGVKRMSVP